MIILTGAAGFIGSCMLRWLNEHAYKDIILVDDFSRKDKSDNYLGKAYRETVDREQFFSWYAARAHTIDAIIHLGARTDTTTRDRDTLHHLNYDFSRKIFELCTKGDIPLVYASSAATYGDGSQGFTDDHAGIEHLRPLNAYGDSKQEMDRWALAQTTVPPNWIGLKFFNVYGPNEYHKGRMASVMLHAYRQISETGTLSLFRSHRPDYQDGEQKRDFIYVKDVVHIIGQLLEHPISSGIYNLGSGKARTFNDLAHGIFSALDRPVQIQYINTPEDIRTNYQYFTQADMEKLNLAGYSLDFSELEAGILDYVDNYLRIKKYY